MRLCSSSEMRENDELLTGDDKSVKIAMTTLFMTKWGKVEIRLACGVLARKEFPESKEEDAPSHLAHRRGD
jgi:hypothetical protein